jgi:hypothetical protein
MTTQMHVVILMFMANLMFATMFMYLLDTSKGVDESCVNMVIKFMWGELRHGLMILYFILCMSVVMCLIYGNAC